ncbi:pleckstrin homology domain-containing family A member 7-like [Anneissia japonica]|uniref:pleckstrin homology domain-containing family A member 7-like n=1 Tax=Anneissia japonica TaxID=1529436 RepID=UPI001425B6C6|nr:pleckstrin homology domain-containing family A member 7-like [Anneissia japonica]
MAERLQRETLPPPWNYAITADGRIFFINDETRTTTWIHPVTEEPVATGLLSREDLPKGWEQGWTTEGAVFFVNHNRETTTFYHPTTSAVEVADNSQFHVKLAPADENNETLTMSLKTQPTPVSVSVNKNIGNKVQSTPEGSTTMPPTTQIMPATPKVKNRVIPKNVVPQVKRRKDDQVTMKGWLYKMGSKFKVWKKVWCVISDFCLFYYKGPNDVNMQGSIVLPSYDIRSVDYADKANKKYAFKCTHQNMRTVIFAAESEQGMKQWIEALSRAAKVQMDLGYGEPVNKYKEIRISDDEDGGFANFSQPTRSEMDHYRSHHSDNGYRTFEDEEQPRSAHRLIDQQEYNRSQSYHQRPNGNIRQKEADNYAHESKDRLVPSGRYHDDDPRRGEEVQEFVDDSATEDEGDAYSDDDIEEVYSEEKDSHKNQTIDDYSLSRDKDYRRLGTQSHTPGLYPASYRTLPRKRSSEYYSSMDDFTWEESASTSVPLTMREDSVFERPHDQEFQRRSAQDLMSPGQEQALQYSDEQSNRSSLELHHRHPNFSQMNHPPDKKHHSGDYHRSDDYRRAGDHLSDDFHHSENHPSDGYRHSDDHRHSGDYHRSDGYQKYDSDIKSATLQHNYSKEPLQSRNNTMPRIQDSNQYSSRNSLPSSNAQLPVNYKRNDNSSQLSYASQRLDESDSQQSYDSQKRDETHSLQSYDSQRRDISHDEGSRSSSRATSPPIRKDYVDGGHIQRKRPESLKFDFKHNNNNYNIQRGGISPEQRSVLQSPWDQHPPLPKEQRSTINSPVTYNPPRPENDAQPLRVVQTELKKMDDEFPEQRSYLQSPLVQSSSPPSLGQEQRSTINSPMVYEDSVPQWPSQNTHDPHNKDNIIHDERIIPKQASSQHMAPGLSRSSTLDSKRHSSSQGRPGSRTGYTEADIAPSRNRLLFDSPPIENEKNQKSRSRENIHNVYSARESDLPRHSSHTGDYQERPRSRDNSYRSQNGSRDPRDSYTHKQRSSGYDSYGEGSQVSEISRGRNRSGYSLDSREYVPHGHVTEYNRPRNERQSNGRASREVSISSGRLPTDRRKDYVPQDSVRRQRSIDYQQSDDDLRSESSSKIQYPSTHSQRRPDRQVLQEETKISPSRQNYQASSIKRRPESMIRAMEDKERRSGDTFPSRGPSRRTTQEIFESEGRDQFPTNSMDDQMPRTTDRFRKWQQKLQPYIILNTGTRVRLSISADDLLGKPHEELVLLLIQLRRDQANLRAMNEMIKTEMTKLTDPDLPADSPTKARARRYSLKNPSKDFTEEEMYLLELNQQKDEVEKEMEISGPLVSLVDNLVRMGSLYGGQNEMLAQQYYRDKVNKGLSYKPPKKLIEFSRTWQEKQLAKDFEKELEELETVEDRELEDKLNHLHFLDTRLQDIAVYITDLKEDKDKIEKALASLHRQSRSHWDDPAALERIKEQQHRLERDLIQVREELAYRTKVSTNKKS